MTQGNSLPANSKPKNMIEKPHGAQKIPRKITQTYLHNAGLYYLGRFSASSTHFRDIMRRKVKRSCAHHTEQNLQICLDMVDTLVETFLRAGLLNDEIYAHALISSLRRRGKSSRAIQAALQAKGISNALILQGIENQNVLQGENAADIEFNAALAHARKRKLGPFRRTKEADLKKELSNMARAGFSYETARRVFNLSNDEIEDHSGA